jgi:hypothetical protein
MAEHEFLICTVSREWLIPKLVVQMRSQKSRRDVSISAERVGETSMPIVAIIQHLIRAQPLADVLARCPLVPGYASLSAGRGGDASLTFP